MLVPVGGEMGRGLVCLTVLFLIYVQTLFLSIAAFVSCRRPNVKWEEGGSEMFQNTLLYFSVQGWQSFSETRGNRLSFIAADPFVRRVHKNLFCANQNKVSESARRQRSRDTRSILWKVSTNVQKENKKGFSVYIPTLWPHPLKPLHAVCNGSLARWGVNNFRYFRCFLFANHGLFYVWRIAPSKKPQHKMDKK